MRWDDNRGMLSFFGTVPIDTDSPIQIGEKVKLTKGEYAFEVEITSIRDQEFDGEILVVVDKPILEIEAFNLKRGDKVTFQESNIKMLYRK